MAPRRTRDWTDASTHDPGVTMLEALAYGPVDLVLGIRRRLLVAPCGWPCLLLVSAGVAATIALLRGRRRASASRRSPRVGRARRGSGGGKRCAREPS